MSIGKNVKLTTKKDPTSGPKFINGPPCKNRTYDRPLGVWLTM